MPNTTLRLITLTLAHSDEPLAAQIDHLFASFRRLRSNREWKTRVKGGAYFLELTRNQTTHQWHPHLHLITEGIYYDHADLKKAWLRASGASIVHITLCRNRRGLSRYVTKYLTEPIDTTTYADDIALQEAINAIHHRRTIGTLGTWTKRRIFSAKPATTHVFVGWLNELRIKAAGGDAIAICLVRAAEQMPNDGKSLEVRMPLVATNRLDQSIETRTADDGTPYDYAVPGP